jgi:hypothetical protein
MSIKIIQDFLNRYTKDLLISFCSSRNININGKKTKEEITDTIIAAEFKNNSNISTCQNCFDLFFEDYLKSNSGNCYRCVISEDKRGEKYSIYSDFIEHTFNHNDEYIKNLEQTLDELKNKIIETEIVLKDKIIDNQEIKNKYERNCQTILNLQNYISEIKKEKNDLELKNREIINNLVLDNNRLTTEKENLERKAKEYHEKINNLVLENKEISQMKDNCYSDFLEVQKQLKNQKTIFQEPKLISALYHNKDVSDILIRNMNGYRFTFVNKDSFNILFGDPAPGIKKQLHLTYKNIFGNTIKNSYNESSDVTIDLLR